MSIVLPAYNEQQEIESAISEMEKQSYKNREILIVDDGSTDNTFNAAKQIAVALNDIQVITTSHGGPSHARNVGIKSSSGEIVFFGECDCTYSADYLELAVKALQDKPTAGAVCLTGGPLEIRRTVAIRCIYLENVLQHTLLNAGKIKPFYAWVYRKEALDKVGGFDENLFQGEDKDLFRRVVSDGNEIAWIPGIHWWHKRSETLFEMAKKWFSRARTRLLFSLKNRLFFDMAKTMAPVWLVVLGIVLLISSQYLVGGILLAVVAAGIFVQAFRTMTATWSSVTEKSVYVYYPVYLATRNFSSGLGYTYGLIRLISLTDSRQESNTQYSVRAVTERKFLARSVTFGHEGD